MTQEDKELLLKDLCARLPYGVKVRFYDHWVEKYEIIPLTAKLLVYNVQIGEIPPYLFPLSSMTEEQKTELEQIKNNEDAPYYHDINDFFLKYHLDNRHLIEKGLAINATGKNIY